MQSPNSFQTGNKILVGNFLGSQRDATPLFVTSKIWLPVSQKIRNFVTRLTLMLRQVIYMDCCSIYASWTLNPVITSLSSCLLMHKIDVF